MAQSLSFGAQQRAHINRQAASRAGWLLVSVMVLVMELGYFIGYGGGKANVLVMELVLELVLV